MQLSMYMPYISAVAKIDFPHKVSQQEVKTHAHDLFVESFPQADRLMSAFDNTEILWRNFCRPLSSYAALGNFEERNNTYVSITVQYAAQAIEECAVKAGVKLADITDIIFVSSTGLATPSIDALIINKLRLNAHINRLPVFGLGCAGGVAGISKATVVARANPQAIVLLVAAELCSLTFLTHDYTKSNFIAASLFSDGIAACIIKGDGHEPIPSTHTHSKGHVKVGASGSKLYYDTEDVMGWQFLDAGFKVLFSQDIPTIINKNVRADVTRFLTLHNLELPAIKNFIFHPGGKKVLTAYAEALEAEGDFLKNTREVMNAYGNMSSATVLYVLEQCLRMGYTDGPGLMLALGPGFSSEMVLLSMSNS